MPSKTAAPASESEVQTPRKRTPRARTSRAVVVSDSNPQDSLLLRKATEALTIRNISAGEITFLQRKAYNAMLQVAQRGDTEQVTFEVPIKEFESLVGHNTPNSRDYLKNMIRQMTSTQVEFDYRGDGKKKGSWGIANLIAEVYVNEETSSIRFSFPPELKKKLLDPAIYNRIDLRMQNLFTSYSALTLYEMVSRYYTSETKRTFAEHWTVWSMLISGSKDPHKNYREFSKMLARAIDQINTHEKRYRIVPHVSKRERKIDQLWFVIEEQQQGQLALGDSPALVGDELLKRLRAYGLEDKEIAQLVVQYDEDYLFAQAGYTDKRLQNKKAKPIGNVKGFYLGAVENNYADVPRRRQTPKADDQAPQKPALQDAPNSKKPDDVMSALADSWRKAKTTEIMVQFRAQSLDKKNEILADLEQDLRKNTIVWRSYQKYGPTRPSVEAAIANIMVEKHLGQPTADELLRFGMAQGLLKSAL